MNNIVEVNYAQTGKSTNTDKFGMREMQALVYKKREQPYLLIKAPPASGKSRALMFVALDKLKHQGIKKVIVSVPEKTIGRSFKDTRLMEYGFFSDWKVAPYFNLCDANNEYHKSKRFIEFLEQESCNILVCTHATLRNAFKEVDLTKFDNTFVAIDEFHHVAADADNSLGEIVRQLMSESSAHIMAMTGSYFRGDGVPILRSEDECKFYPITYNYYQQLNGYKYLKSLGLGYHFYQGNYLDAIKEVLDTTKKTIIHIPYVSSKASAAMDKYEQVDLIIKKCGTLVEKDYNTGIVTVRTPDGRLIKIADLVEDDAKSRNLLQAFLQKVKNKDELDIIIALGTAKEGFDWVWCEHCLTVGVRGSLTEIVQIIGRCTRDCEGKTHAQFTNLIAAPEAEQADVTKAVNDMLKAITSSLLMEQVMAPSWKFKTRKNEEDEHTRGREEFSTLVIKGLKEPSTEKSKHIIENDLIDLTATVLNSDIVARAIGGGTAPEVINKVLVPKVIMIKYPDLNAEEEEEVRQHLIASIVLKGNLEQEGNSVQDEGSEGNRIIRLANRFINIDELSISLIDSINPFQRAYEIMSKELNAPVLKVIQDAIAERKFNMSVEEAKILFFGPYKTYVAHHDGRLPSIDDPNLKVKRLAQAFIVLKNLKIRYEQGLEFKIEEEF